MPTVKKKFMSLKKDRPKKDPKVFNEVRYRWLISEMLELIGEENPFGSEEDERACYQANKSQIMERWLADPQNYCRRPKCFQWFEELQPKQIIGRERWFNPMDGPGKWELSPILESDHTWLNRLGLLEEKEVKRFQELQESEAKERAGMIELGLFLPVEKITTN